MANLSRRAAYGVGLLTGFLALSGFRPDDPDSTGLFRFEPGHDVEAFDGLGGRVRVHFTRTGPDAVSLVDTDDGGVPDSVEQVAAAYEEVLAFFAAQRFREPVSDLDNPLGDGGNDRLDVYLVDFAGQSDGAFVRDRCEASTSICSGYIVQENDFAGYGYPSFRVASRILASHELFHVVQAAYDADQGANWSEATATWASEHFDPSLTDFEYFVRGWFDKPDRSIDQEPIGPVDGFSYGLAIFAQYLSERFGDDIIREHWEDLEDGAQGVADPKWLPALIALLEREHETTFADAWVEFAEWVIRSGQGQVEGSFTNVSSYPRVAREIVQFPFEDDRLRVYRSSLQVWAGGPSGRAEVKAALASEDPTELAELTLILAARKGAVVTSVQAVAAEGEGVVEASLPVAGADEVIVVVASAAVSGQSKRPGLCIGDGVEVAACIAARLPVEPGPEVVEVVEPVESSEPVEPEVVETDVGDVADGEDGEPVVEPRRGDADGCGQGPAPFVGVWALLALVRRRRRHGLRG